jgi:hypothetical protein
MTRALWWALLLATALGAMLRPLHSGTAGALFREQADRREPRVLVAEFTNIGLANRIRTISRLVVLAAASGRDLVLHWLPGTASGARWDDLFLALPPWDRTNALPYSGHPRVFRYSGTWWKRECWERVLLDGASVEVRCQDREFAARHPLEELDLKQAGGREFPRLPDGVWVHASTTATPTLLRMLLAHRPRDAAWAVPPDAGVFFADVLVIQTSSPIIMSWLTPEEELRVRRFPLRSWLWPSTRPEIRLLALALAAGPSRTPPPLILLTHPPSRRQWAHRPLSVLVVRRDQPVVDWPVAPSWSLDLPIERPLHQQLNLSLPRASVTTAAFDGPGHVDKLSSFHQAAPTVLLSTLMHRVLATAEVPHDVLVTGNYQPLVESEAAAIQGAFPHLRAWTPEQVLQLAAQWDARGDPVVEAARKIAADSISPLSTGFIDRGSPVQVQRALAEWWAIGMAETGVGVCGSSFFEEAGVVGNAAPRWLAVNHDVAFVAHLVDGGYLPPGLFRDSIYSYLRSRSLTAYARVDIPAVGIGRDNPRDHPPREFTLDDPEYDPNHPKERNRQMNLALCNHPWARRLGLHPSAFLGEAQYCYP